MIRVPAIWRCARYDCLLVELSEDFFLLCRCIPLSTPTTVFSINLRVFVPKELAHDLTSSQNIAECEERTVHWLARSSADATWLYIPYNVASPPLQEHTTEFAKLKFYCILETCLVRSVVCKGLRLDARATIDFLSATMLGCYVVPKCVIDTASGSYQVDQVEKSGAGFGRVGSDCRIRVNDNLFVPGKAMQSQQNRPIGLEDALAQFTLVLSMAEKGVGGVTGLLIHGPKGCGVGNLVEYCVRSRPAIEILRWSTSFDASFVRGRIGASVVIFYLPSCERFFPSQEIDLARLTLRKLLKDVNLFRTTFNGHKLFPLVIATTHHLGSHCATDVLKSFFRVNIALSLPTLDQRAALFASVRGGSPSDWLGEVNSLIGKTSFEVLNIARMGGWRYTPPFKEVRWGDIGGLREVKERLHRGLIWPQLHPQVFKRFNLSQPKGILLYGPPGCAKTTLVKALCSEGYFSLIYLDSASVISAYVGESERRLRDVFAQASQRSPCIVFFDEVEVIAARRETGTYHAQSVRLLSTLLTEMDGFTASHGVCFVGATNVPHLLDPALLRPGRFDYLVYVPIPSANDRKEILSLHLNSAAVDVSVLANMTEGFSGADLSALCSSALLDLLGESEEPPAILRDTEWMTSFMVDKIHSYQRSSYDSTGLENFRRKHDSV